MEVSIVHKKDAHFFVILLMFLLDIMHLKCIISTKEIMHEPNLYQEIFGAGPKKGCY